MLTFPCAECAQLTEWFDLSTEEFYCDLWCLGLSQLAQCDTSEVIHSTREIRRMPRWKCPITGNQKCHIFGLNAAKVILNTYATQRCLRVDETTVEALIRAINADQNLYCCSVEQNTKDKETEEQLLACFIDRTVNYSALSEEARQMYNAMKRVFGQVATSSEVIRRILKDFSELELL